MLGPEVCSRLSEKSRNFGSCRSDRCRGVPGENDRKGPRILLRDSSEVQRPRVSGSESFNPVREREDITRTTCVSDGTDLIWHCSSA